MQTDIRPKTQESAAWFWIIVEVSVAYNFQTGKKK
jgi:hypothetical protein